MLNDMAKKSAPSASSKGAITFETQEVKFKLDENGKPLGVYVKERKDAHKLIEEFMLLANRKVAEFVFNLKKTKPRFTMVYRTHDAPDPERLANFALFAQKFGYKLKLDNPKKISTELNSLSSEVVGKPEQNVIQGLAIRTMAKAIYTTEPLGHFGLAFEHYSHFTSPIRRYPDMMAHRLLEHYLRWRQKRARRAGGRRVQALLGPRETGRRCRARQHQVQAGRVYGRAHRQSSRAWYRASPSAACTSKSRKTSAKAWCAWPTFPATSLSWTRTTTASWAAAPSASSSLATRCIVVVKSANLLDRTIHMELVDNRPEHVKQSRSAPSASSRGGEPRGYRDYDKGGKGGMAKGAHKGNKRR